MGSQFCENSLSLVKKFRASICLEASSMRGVCVCFSGRVCCGGGWCLGGADGEGQGHAPVIPSSAQWLSSPNTDTDNTLITTDHLLPHERARGRKRETHRLGIKHLLSKKMLLSAYTLHFHCISWVTLGSICFLSDASSLLQHLLSCSLFARCAVYLFISAYLRISYIVHLLHFAPCPFFLLHFLPVLPSSLLPASLLLFW